MLPQNVLLALAAACAVSALPLNINLGAYSPALVVGDGEISIGGAESTTGILETLQSATEPNGANRGNGAAAGQAAPQPVAGATNAAAEGTTLPGGGQVNAVDADASADNGDGPSTTITDANGNAVGSQSADGATIIVPPAASLSSASADANVANVIEQGLEPSSMIGLNPNNRRVNLAARTVDVAGSADAPSLAPARRQFKRDIAGFREALSFAMNAMKNTPEIDLGTEAAGVGILQRPGVAVPGGTPAAGTSGGRNPTAAAATPAKKREEGGETKKAGITLLAITEI